MALHYLNYKCLEPLAKDFQDNSNLKENYSIMSWEEVKLENEKLADI